MGYYGLLWVTMGFIITSQTLFRLKSPREMMKVLLLLFGAVAFANAGKTTFLTVLFILTTFQNQHKFAVL